jgi:hypothetical protein
MSIEAMGYVFNIRVGQSTRKLVLVGYANHAHKDGTAAFPAIDTIAKYADCDRRSVQRHVATLLAEGFMREGDQELVSHLPRDRRPIVYDVAMSEQQREDWKAAAVNGKRSVAAKHGRAGGEASAQVKRGDNLTPREVDGSPIVVTARITEIEQAPERGDAVVTPLTEPSETDGVTPVTRRGDADVTPRGDIQGTDGVTPVSPNPSLNRPVEPSMNNSAPSSLRSTDTGVESDQEEIDLGLPPVAKPKKQTKADRDEAERQLTADAQEVADWWWQQAEKVLGPCVLGGNPFMRLRTTFVKPALKQGMTKRQVCDALKAINKHLPFPSEWQTACSKVLGNSAGGRSRVHRDAETWGALGDDADRPSVPMTREELIETFGPDAVDEQAAGQ